MNTARKITDSESSHYWMLWVSPSKEQTQEIRNLPQEQRDKVLMLHPKNLDRLQSTLNSAITCDLYQSITVQKHLLSLHQRHQIQVLAARHNTVIVWLNKQSSMNSACQLSLLY